MTATEQTNFQTKMNQAITSWNGVTWGNNNPESNYFWGYWRNSLLSVLSVTIDKLQLQPDL
jgi:hypothetical protein